MDPIRGLDSIKVVDLRHALGISPAAMTTIMKKKGFAGRSLNADQARSIMESRGITYPSQKPIIITFIVSKGGTAKTTSTRFLGIRLAAYGCKVLLVDMDPQGNLTKSFKLDKYGLKLTPEDPVIADILERNKNPDLQARDAIIQLTPCLHLLPSTPINSRCDNVIRDNYKNPGTPLRPILTSLTEYDYILNDCGPSLSITNTSAIGAADRIILPVDPDDFSMMGIEDTLKEIKQIRKECNLHHDVDIRIFLTKYDEREYLSVKLLADVKGKYTEHALRTHIRRSSDLKNTIHDDTDLYNLPKSRAKEDYDELAREIMGILPEEE